MLMHLKLRILLSSLAIGSLPMLSGCDPSSQQQDKIVKRDLPKPRNNLDALEIDGLILDETRSKIGRDFYEIFYNRWTPPSGAKDFLITIRELPGRGIGSRISIEVNENIILYRFLQPRNDLVEEEANLTMIQDFKNRFGVISGLSDHTLGSTAAVVASCLGAKIIEKHFILDRSIGGPDASFSLDEKEFTQMVQEVRDAEKAIGKVSYELTEKQQAGKAFSRSLYVVQDIKKGERFTEENIRSIRPGFGLHPKYYKKILGKKANTSMKKGDRLTF